MAVAGNASIPIPSDALVLLIGASGSGKSTYAERHFNADEVVSSDRLRVLISGDESDQRMNDAVFARLHRWVEDRLAAGRLAVVDATNVEWVWRADLLRIARRFGRRAIAIVFDVDAEVCVRRNASRARVVRPRVIQRQVQHLRHDLARLDLEGFSAVHILRA